MYYEVSMNRHFPNKKLVVNKVRIILFGFFVLGGIQKCLAVKWHKTKINTPTCVSVYVRTGLSVDQVL